MRVEITEVEAELALHSHEAFALNGRPQPNGELWVKVQSDDPALTLTEVKMAMSRSQKTTMALAQPAPCAYYPDSPTTDEEKVLGAYIDWWVFPLRKVDPAQ